MTGHKACVHYKKSVGSIHHPTAKQPYSSTVSGQLSAQASQLACRLAPCQAASRGLASPDSNQEGEGEYGLRAASTGATAAAASTHTWTQQRKFRRQARALLNKASTKQQGMKSGKVPAPAQTQPLSNNIVPTVCNTDGKRSTRTSALVLDSAYRPINVVHWKRAVEWDVDQKAEVLDYYEPPAFALSGRGLHPLPAVIRMPSRSVNLAKLITRVACTRRNVMTRDHFTCQYCGAQQNLTLDHIIPASKGGRDTWTNLVTACTACNQKKRDLLLSQVKNMRLRTEPREPSVWELGIVVGLTASDLENTPKQWQPWVAPYRERYDKIQRSMKEAGLGADVDEDEVEEEAVVVLEGQVA